VPDPDILKSSGQPGGVRQAGLELSVERCLKRIASRPAASWPAAIGLQLAKIEAVYGVDSAILIAIWGIETSFGIDLADLWQRQEHHPLPRDDRSRRWQPSGVCEEQLIAALKIVDSGTWR